MAQDRIDPNSIRWEGAAARKQDQAEVEGEQSTVIRGQTIEKNAATIPYAAPQAAVDLENAQTRAKFSNLEQSQKLRTNFEALKPVRDYADSIGQLSAALNTAPNSAGDQMLLYYAAKIADPGSVVREGEQQMWAAAQPVVQRLQERFKKEIMGGGGQFDERQRRIIRAELIRNIKDRRKGYERERRNYERTAKGYGLDPADVLGEHAGQTYLDDMRAYDQKRAKERAVEAQTAETPTTDVFGTPPGGSSIKTEDIKAYRFSPEQEQELTTLLSSSDLTPEAYADRATQFAVENKSIPPEAAEQFRADALGRVADIAKMPPEERAKARFRVDYSEADKTATENAGLFDSVAQAVKNAPESSAQLIQGLSALPVDSLVSLVEGRRYGAFKSTTDLAGELIQMAGGEPAGPTVKAVADVLDERYGGVDNFKRTAVKDPVGLASDLSIVLTGGGTLAAKGPGTIGKIGEKVATVGRVIDPLSAGIGAVTEGIPAAYNAAQGKAPRALEGVKNLPSDVVGLFSGVGGSALREGAKAGFERGKAGAPTARSEAFTEGMRSPGASGEELVDAARSGVAQLREQAAQDYTRAMQQFGQQPVPLNIDNVRMALARVKPKNFDAMLDAPRRPSDHTAWEQMNDTVEHYAAKAADDPSLLEPLAMDQFKQDLYDIGSKIGGAFDRDAARIAGKAYGAVKKELVDHDPLYAKIMSDYEKAAKEVQQLESAFSLGAARGKQPNIEQAVRRLQSVMRNNAYTNYGTRTGMAERLAALDPSGTLMPSIAGQSASSWTPRGLQAATAVGVGGAGVLGGVPLWGPQAAMAPLFSPRVMGEAAHGAGQLAGTAARVAEPAVDTSRAAAQWLLQKYQDNPQAALVASQLGEGARAVEERKRDEMLRKYGVSVAPLDYEELDRYAGR